MNFRRSKTFALTAVALVVAAVALYISSHSVGLKTESRSEVLYTCGMHPQIIASKPGNCPICGMKLTPIRQQPSVQTGLSDGANSRTGHDERKIKFYKSTMTPGETSPTKRRDSMGMEMVPVYEDEANATTVISIDPVTVQNMGLRTGPLERGPLRRTIRSVGIIEFDETALADVTTKFRGWIEKLYADSTGKQVHRGEPLFEIYSPDLYNAQVEYLLALDQSAKSTSGTDTLRASALTKLKFFDISDPQIADLAKTKVAKKTLQVNAPRDGIVVEKMAVQGQMVEAGMKLYRLADLSLVWVLSQVYEQDLPYLKLGQEAVVRLSYLPDREFRGRVTYIYPTLDEKTRTAKVRMEFHNPGFFLKPGMFATVELRAELEESSLLVPDSAVLRSGEKNTVFISLSGGQFEPRIVTLGPRAENNMYQVLSGLNEGERVVISGQFMLDSESQLREAIQKMLHPTEVTSKKIAEESANSGKQHDGKLGDGKASAYICPMPEHVAIKYDHPGKCPICSMTLVPVSDAALAKLQPGGKVEHYTCPMPEHVEVKLAEPGKCPRCGMTLIPVMKAPSPVTQAPAARPLPPSIYTCPMAIHADIVSDKPGKCPKCEMELVSVRTVEHGKIAEEHWRRRQTSAIANEVGGSHAH